MKVLALVAEAFGGRGGIAQYNRDLLTALGEYSDEVIAVPRIVQDPVTGVPQGVRFLHDAASGKFRFGRAVARTLWQTRRLDLVVCAHVHLLPVAYLAARFRGARLALGMYGVDVWEPTKSALANRLCGRADQYFSISRITAERFAAWSGVAARRCHILPNAIHRSRYAPGEKPRTLSKRLGLQDKKVIMTLGRYSQSERYKGVDQVLECLPALLREDPEFRYLVVGAGDDLERLQRKAGELGVAEQAVFTGWVSDVEKADYYRLADVYAMPSTGEGFGFVFLEAMACGIPVVASRVDGSREALRDGQLGQLVDPSNQGELKSAIIAAAGLPKAVPEGLDYFSFTNFSSRLAAFLNAAH